ncbi:hypothetical protein QL285_083995 [Trifolium repens]|nr:hypothetical protein QL285_083995 [Trifolium repens]
MNKPENLDPNLAHLTVADLLHQNAKEWDSDLIHGLVDETTTAKILQTPFLESVQSDKITWKHEKNRLYTVKSAYRACIVNNSNREQDHVDGRWQLIWRSKVPPKIKKILWQVCRNCLPTRVCLHDRGVDCPDSCVLCDAGNEDSLYLFFSCQNSILYWQVGLWSNIMQTRDLTSSVNENVFKIMGQLN